MFRSDVFGTGSQLLKCFLRNSYIDTSCQTRLTPPKTKSSSSRKVSSIRFGQQLLMKSFQLICVFVVDRQKGVRLKVFSVLKKWVEDHYSDFEENDRLRNRLRWLLSNKLAV